MRPSSSTRHARQHGFTLVELLVVAGIIAIMAAVALPAIARYIRNYKIRGAAQEVAGQIQAARTKAVMKNVNLGVVWLAWREATGDRIAWVVEDDLQPPVDWSQPEDVDLAALLANPNQRGSTVVTLPQSVTFDAPANCPGAPTGTAADWGIHFNRLGGTCQMVVDTACPPPGTVATTYSSNSFVLFSGGTATLCLLDNQTDLRLRIDVTPGGRVLVM